MQGIYPETYLKKENKWKELMEEIDTETWQKMKKTNWKNIKKFIKSQKNWIKIFLNCIKISEKNLNFDEVKINENISHLQAVNHYKSNLTGLNPAMKTGYAEDRDMQKVKIFNGAVNTILNGGGGGRRWQKKA